MAPPSDGPNTAHIAGFRRRLAAMLYDSVLWVAWCMVLTMVHLLVWRWWLGLPVEQLGQGSVQIWSLRLWLLLGTFLFVYAFWRRGMTLGMRAWRLRLQSLDGQPPVFRQLLVRFMVGALSWGLLGLGHAWMLWDPQRRTWADMASATRIVEVSRRWP